MNLKRGQKFFSLLLALVMVISLLPVMAAAEDAENPIAPDEGVEEICHVHTDDCYANCTHEHKKNCYDDCKDSHWTQCTQNGHGQWKGNWPNWCFRHNDSKTDGCVKFDSCYYYHNNTTCYPTNCNHTHKGETRTCGQEAREDHNWKPDGDPTPATCTEPGEQKYKCDNCGATGTQVLPTIAHNLEEVNAQEPTCEEIGWAAYEYCSECDYTTYEEIPVLTHEHAFPDCYGCTHKHGWYCNNGWNCYHNFNNHYCNELGVTCEIPEEGHIWDEGEVTTPATCTEPGEKTYTCQREGCGATKTESVAAPGHSYEAVVTAPTCTEGGYTTYTCAVCGDSYVADEVAATGHDWQKVNKKNPTCTEPGCDEHYKCKKCDMLSKKNWFGQYYEVSKENVIKPALGHDWNYGFVTIKPTCSNEGVKTFTCLRWGCHVTKTEFIPATEHNWGEWFNNVYGNNHMRVCKNNPYHFEFEAHDYKADVTAPTCTEGGYTTYTCAVCGDSYVADEVAALGHSYEAVVTAPTCTEGGYTTYTCAVCGDSYVADEVAALGHDWGVWFIEVQPTYTAEGVEKRICKRDASHVETRAVEKIPEPITPVGPSIAKPMVKNLNTTDHVAYIIGYADGTVRPTANITRAQVATIYFRLMTDEARDEFWSTENPYLDVNASDWFNTAVSTLYAAGVIVDVEDGNFRPNDPITRAELAVMAAQFYSGKAVKGNSSFEDVDEDYWAAKEIAIVEKAGWIEGYNGFYRPDDTITRAETMTIVNRMLQRAVEADDMLDDMVTFSDNLPSLWYYEAVQEATNSHTYKRTGDMVDEEEYRYEKWLKILEAPDWAAQEAAWQAANSN